MRGNHPPACTCVSCEAKRTGHRPGRQVWRGRDITPGRPPQGKRSRGSGNVGRPPVSTQRAPGPTSPVRASKGAGKGLVAVLFLLGIMVGGGGVWWWSTQEPESFGRATEGVPRAAPNEGSPAVPPANPAEPAGTPAPVIVPAAPPPTPAPTPTVPVAATSQPTVEPTPTPPATPTCPPTPTLNAMQIMMLVDSGKISKEEAVKMLECLKGGTMAEPVASATAVPTEAPLPQLVSMPAPTPAATPTNEGASELESLVTRLINEERVSRGLSTLKNDPDLVLIARAHSQDMADNNYFSHTNLAGEGPTNRGIRQGYVCRKDYGSYYKEGIAENIYKGWLFSSVTYVGSTAFKDMYTMEELANIIVGGWMNSPGHRSNILEGTYDRGGLGIAISVDDKVLVTHKFC